MKRFAIDIVLIIVGALFILFSKRLVEVGVWLNPRLYTEAYKAATRFVICATGVFIILLALRDLLAN